MPPKRAATAAKKTAPKVETKDLTEAPAMPDLSPTLKYPTSWEIIEERNNQERRRLDLEAERDQSRIYDQAEQAKLLGDYARARFQLERAGVPESKIAEILAKTGERNIGFQRLPTSLAAHAATQESARRRLFDRVQAAIHRLFPGTRREQLDEITVGLSPLQLGDLAPFLENLKRHFSSFEDLRIAIRDWIRNRAPSNPQTGSTTTKQAAQTVVTTPAETEAELFSTSELIPVPPEAEYPNPSELQPTPTEELPYEPPAAEAPSWLRQRRADILRESNARRREQHEHREPEEQKYELTPEEEAALTESQGGLEFTPRSEERLRQRFEQERQEREQEPPKRQRPKPPPLPSREEQQAIAARVRDKAAMAARRAAIAPEEEESEPVPAPEPEYRAHRGVVNPASLYGQPGQFGLTRSLAHRSHAQLANLSLPELKALGASIGIPYKEKESHAHYASRLATERIRPRLAALGTVPADEYDELRNPEGYNEKLGFGLTWRPFGSFYEVSEPEIAGGVLRIRTIANRRPVVNNSAKFFGRNPSPSVLSVVKEIMDGAAPSLHQLTSPEAEHMQKLIGLSHGRRGPGAGRKKGSGAKEPLETLAEAPKKGRKSKSKAASVMERIEILRGEIEAGNDSPEILTELTTLARSAYRNKKINRATFQELIGAISDTRCESPSESEA